MILMEASHQTMDSSTTSRRLCAIALANLEPAATPLPRPAKRRSLRLSQIHNLFLLLSVFSPTAGGAILQPTTTNLRLRAPGELRLRALMMHGYKVQLGPG